MPSPALIFPVPRSLLQGEYDGYTDDGQKRKSAFHKDAKAFFKKMVKILNIGEYELRTNPAGIAVSGEVTLHTDKLYMQMSEYCFGRPGLMILYRSCKGMEDYTGGTNNFARLDSLTTHAAQEIFLQRLESILKQGV